LIGRLRRPLSHVGSCADARPTWRILSLRQATGTGRRGAAGRHGLLRAFAIRPLPCDGGRNSKRDAAPDSGS
jgi:hypothetical protein